MKTLKKPLFLDSRLADCLQFDQVKSKWRDAQELWEKMKFLAEQQGSQADLARKILVPLCEMSGCHLTTSNALERISNQTDLCYELIAEIDKLDTSPEVKSKVSELESALDNYLDRYNEATLAQKRIVSLADNAYDRLIDLERVERETQSKFERTTDCMLELSEWVAALHHTLERNPVHLGEAHLEAKAPPAGKVLSMVKGNGTRVNYRVAVIANWRRYQLPHVACGFVNLAELEAKGSATMTFGDGTWIEIQDPADIILTDIPCEAIEE